MEYRLKSVWTLALAVAGLTASAQPFRHVVDTRMPVQMRQHAKQLFDDKARMAEAWAPAFSQQPAAAATKRALKRDAEVVKPGSFYTVAPGYYNLVPGYGVAYENDEVSVYAEHGILGFIDRDIVFTNRTPEYDSFYWTVEDNTYTYDEIMAHPLFNEQRYMEPPLLTATLAGVDSTYQMGAYVQPAEDGQESKTVPGMIALSGGAFVYNVDIPASPFSETSYGSLSGDWNSMIFGYEKDLKTAYMEMFDAPAGGNAALASTLFHVVTPNTVDLSGNPFKVTWVAKQKGSGEWKSLAQMTSSASYMPESSGNGLRLWRVLASPEDQDFILVEDSFYVMIEGPHDAQWAMFHYYRSNTVVNEKGEPVDELDPVVDKNTAYFVYLEGEQAGTMGQYMGTTTDNSGNTVYVRRNASLDIHQYVITPYMLLVEKDLMNVNQTGMVDIAATGETLDYYLSDWRGGADSNVAITATVSASTDGDWLTVKQPAAAEGANLSYMFTFGVEASYLDFDTEGRRATVTLTDNAGFSRDIVVYQGDHDAADEALAVAEVNASGKVKAVCDGEEFLLTYPTGYCSLSVYDISGKLLDSRSLSPAGSDRISASGLRNGIYLLQFVGKDAQTVKVLK